MHSLHFHFQLKYESCIHNIVSLVDKSESGEKYAEINHHLQVKTVLNKYGM